MTLYCENTLFTLISEA